MYREDTSTKTNDGGLKQMRKQHKVVWVHPNTENVSHCLVHLVDKYISLCPAYFKKPNFYLQSLQKTNPAQWYGEQAVGINSLKKVVKNLLGKANIDGYFTNHSLRCTGSTRLFQAGIDRKIVKEVTGHVSDAIDEYQITSDSQKETVSKVIATSKKEEECDIEPEYEEYIKQDTVPIVQTVSVNGKTACTCNKTYSPNNSNIGEMINSIVEGQRRGLKATVKIKIQFNDDK